MFGQSAYVGLAAPGERGSWQRESKANYFPLHKFPMEYQKKDDWIVMKCRLLFFFSYLNSSECAQGYQFWSEADELGYFVIKNIRPGDYNLYAWVPGFIGDYKNDTQITIKPGNNLLLQLQHDLTHYYYY